MKTMELLVSEKKKMGRHDAKPLLLKVGIAFAVSFAGYLFCRFKLRLHFKPRPSSGRSRIRRPINRGLKDELGALQPADITVSLPVEFTNKVESSPRSCIGGHEWFLLPEFDELVSKGLSVSRMSLPGELDIEVKKTEKNEIEIKTLKDQVHLLEERERNLEMQLLEYYGLQEQDSIVRELENRLKIDSMELKLFKLKVEALQADNRKLQEEFSNYSRTASKLESARKKIKLLRKKMRTQNELAKIQFSALQNCLAVLQAKGSEACSKGDEEIQKRLNRLQDLEDEAVVLRKMNETLQQENLQLMLKLDFAESVASATNSEVHEGEVIDKGCLEEVNTLKDLNKKLANDLERLQMDRCADVEQLVYLRWINACLRYELRNFQPPPGKSFARDLNKNWSPKSEEKAKELILEYGGLADFDSECCTSSQASTLTATGEFDDSLSSLAFHHASRHGSSSKNKLFDRLKRMVLGKDPLERLVSMARSSNSVSNTKLRRSTVSRSGTDAQTGSFSCESFSSLTTVDCSSSASYSDAGSKSLRSEDVQHSRPRMEVGLESTRSDMSISRSSSETQERRETCLGDHMSGYRISERSKSNSTRTHDPGKMLKDCHGEDFGFLHEGNGGQVHESEIFPEKLEILKFAEVLKSSRRPVEAQTKPAFSSF